MKKLFMLFLITMVSCKAIVYTERIIPAGTEINFLDFTRFIDKGFIFSTESINQEYVPLGIISISYNPYRIEKWGEYSPSSLTPTGARHEIEDGVEYIVIPAGSKPVDLNEALDKVYNSAKEVGANGVLFLRFNKLENNVVELTGTAVRVKN